MGDVPDNLEARIKEIIVERLFLEIAPADLGGADSLTETYGVDSVMLFDMVVGLEADFDVSFEDEELSIENFDTVAAVAARVTAKIEEP